MLCLVVAPLLTSCDDYDTFTTDRSAVLQFSKEKVEFDTLITTIPSSTQTLVVYNHGDAGIRITEVRLENGSASPFRVNVDGQDISLMPDKRATDFEVRRRDSIVVRAEVTLPEFSSDDPQQVTDRLILTLESGVQQIVPFSVVGRDAFFLRNRTLAADTTFSARRPIVVYGNLQVKEGVTLTMEAGTQVYFHEGAQLMVHGTWLAQGTLEAPVVLRGDRTDRMFEYLPYDRLPSRWEGVTLDTTSVNNQLEYVDLHSGKWGIRCAPSSPDSPDALKLKLLNSRIHNLGGIGLEVTDCSVEVANTEVSNTLGDCVSMLGGNAEFIHSTLAQFYPLDANRGNALGISCFREKEFHALERADFINCVITGYAEDVIIIPSLNPTDWPKTVPDAVINYLFRNCFLATEVPAGDEYASRFQNNVYEQKEGEITREKNFKLFDSYAFLYDFTPVEGSYIRGAADASYVETYPLDRLGRSRQGISNLAAGCYEYAK